MNLASFCQIEVILNLRLNMPRTWRSQSLLAARRHSWVNQLYGLCKRRGSPRSLNSGLHHKDGPALSFERRVQRPHRNLAQRQSSALVPVHGGHSPCMVCYD